MFQLCSIGCVEVEQLEGPANILVINFSKLYRIVSNKPVIRNFDIGESAVEGLISCFLLVKQEKN